MSTAWNITEAWIWDWLDGIEPGYLPTPERSPEPLGCARKRQMGDQADDDSRGRSDASPYSTSLPTSRSGPPTKKHKRQADDFDKDEAVQSIAQEFAPPRLVRAPVIPPPRSLRSTASRSRTQASDSCSPTTRSQSPTKKLEIQRLYGTVPQIVFGTLMLGDRDRLKGDSSEKIAEVPCEVLDLIHRFSDANALGGCIPHQLKDNLRQYNAVGIPEEAYNPTYKGDHAALLRSVKTILATADKAFHADEHNWYQTVEKVLEAVLMPMYPQCLEVVMVQMASVRSFLLPTLDGEPIKSVKVDIALQFNKANEVFSSVLDTATPGGLSTVNLSPFNAVQFHNATPIAVLIEVKSSQGCSRTGRYQVGVAATALQKVISILDHDSEPSSESLPLQYQRYRFTCPVVGWVVEEHMWLLYIVYRQTTGCVRVYGPFYSGNTASFLGIFQLLEVVRRVTDWASTDYWLYLEHLIKNGTREAFDILND